MKIPKKFPVMGIADDGDIVLFIGPNKTGEFLKGMCIGTTPGRSHMIGYYTKDWIPSCFKLFKGSITVGPLNPVNPG